MALLARSSNLMATAARPTSAARMIAPRRTVRVQAAKKLPEIDIDTEAITAKANEVASSTATFIKERWEATEDKPGAVLVAGAGLIALWLGLSVTSFVDRIPVLSSLVELVGVAVIGYVTFRYLTVGPDRDELFLAAKGVAGKVLGGAATTTTAASAAKDTTPEP